MFIKEYSLKENGNHKIQEHFKVREFACKDGTDKMLIDIDGVCMLEDMRISIGKPIIIISAYRTSEYNKSVGGADNSYHLKGQAFDIRVDGLSPTLLALYASKVGFNGIIIYKDFIHLDTRENIYYNIK